MKHRKNKTKQKLWLTPETETSSYNLSRSQRGSLEQIWQQHSVIAL